MSEIVDCISFIVRKAFWSFWIFLKFVGLRLLDLLGLIFNCLACCTLIRLPHMILHYIHLESLVDWRWIGFVQLCIFISDIPIIIMSIILIVTIWRVYPTYKELQKEWNGSWLRSGVYYSGWKVRKVIIKHFFTLFVDAFCVPSALIVLLSWRCVIFIRKIKNAKDDWERRKACFVEFFQLLLDVPCLLAFAIVCVTWRLPFVVKKVRKRINKQKSWNKIRVVGLKNLPLLVIDIPCILLFLLLCITWRCPILLSNLFDYKQLTGSEWEWNVRKEVCLQSLFILLDIPCIVLFVIVMVTLWRSFDLYTRLARIVTKSGRSQVADSDYEAAQEAFIKKEFQIRSLCCKEFGMLFLDVLCFFVLLIVIVSCWRLPTFVRRLRKYHLSIPNEKNKLVPTYDIQLHRRGILVEEFGMIFVDMLFFLLFLVVACSLWRLYPLIQDVKKYIRQYRVDKPRRDAVETKSVAETNGLNSPVNNQHLSADECSPLNSSSLPRDYGIAESSVDEHIEPVDNVLDSSEVKENIVGETNNAENVTSDPAAIVSEQVSAEKLDISHPSHSGQHLSAQSNQNETDVDSFTMEEENEELKEPLTWSKCMWKIRKSVGINFVFLFIDLPAIPLTILLIVTLIRLPQLVSALFGSSNFFLEFALTVYYQTFRWFLDILFLILFILLAILRPVTTWVHILEDDDHQNYRKLLEIKQWVPDAVADRQDVSECINDAVCKTLKDMAPVHIIQSKLNAIMEPYVNNLESIVQRFIDAEVEDEYVHLVKCVIFWEKKRVGKYIRKYNSELVYLQCADTTVHSTNQHRIKRELVEFDNIVDSQYKALNDYSVKKVPLWSDQSGLSIHSREETQKILIHCLPRGTLFLLLLALLCCVPLYRAPFMIVRLVRRWYDRANIILSTLKEYGLDMLTVLRMLLVIVCVYRAPLMIAEVYDCIIEKRSWAAARSVVKRYPPQILEDLGSSLVALLSWKTPRFLLSTLLFGLFMPAELFITVIRISVQVNVLAYLLTAVMYLFFMGFPFVMSLHLGQYLLEYGLGWTNVVVICSFFALFLMTLLLLVIAMLKDRERLFLLAMPECEYMRLNWFNMHVILFEILEFLQMALLIFKLNVPMYGGNILTEASKYVLFSFLSFEPIFYITVTVFTIWFFVCGAPIVLENILETYDVGTFGKKMSWRLTVSLLANTLFVTMIENLASFTACTYISCPASEVLGNITVNSSCLVSKLVEDSTVSCWYGEHQAYATFGLLGLVWYGSTSLIFSTRYGDPDGSEQDVGFAPLYNTVMNIFKGVMVLCAATVTTNSYVVIGVLIGFNFLCLVFTIIFKNLFGYAACNLASILVWRAATFAECIIVAVAVLVAFRLDDSASFIPLVVICAGAVLVFIVASIVAACLRQSSNIIEDRKMFQEEILHLESKLLANKQLISGWPHKKVWRRLVKTVHTASKDDRVYVKPLWEDDLREQAFSQHSGLSEPNFHLKTGELPPSEGPSPDQQITDTHDQSPSVDADSAKFSPPEAIHPPSLPPPPPSYDASFAMDSVDVPPVMQLPSDLTKLPDDPVRVEKNGRNLLLILEKFIHYESYRYSFLQQRNIWLNSVWKSNWTGLLECLRILSSNLTGTYNQPTRIDVALSRASHPGDVLGDDVNDVEEPPVYLKETKEMIESKSKELRAQALADFASIDVYGEHWSRIMDKILPTTPVIKGWHFDNIGGIFEIALRKPVRGTITAVAPDGVKLAIGAQITVNKKKMCGRVVGGHIMFEEGFCPIGQKGPIKVSIKDVSLVKRKGKWYIESDGKRAKLDVAISSCDVVEWR